MERWFVEASVRIREYNEDARKRTRERFEYEKIRDRPIVNSAKLNRRARAARPPQRVYGWEKSAP